ncbi:MAG: hydrogenase expression/formation protein HypE, partial [Deltaproteobacteria bacterium]|nr:hydrogenase expression/formation protein HypE [Deltaproteobacteria bacterium]
TSGIGVLDHDYDIRGSLAEVGDKILINGTMGDHGMAVLACREGLTLDTSIQTDSIALNHLVHDLIAQCGTGVHVLRDPTRGGVATTLKEIALQSEVQITLDEAALPMNPAVAAACSLLGFDPLFVANEGKLLAFVKADLADQALRVLAQSPGGQQAAIIGEVTAKGPGQVRLKTAIGGLRAVEMLAGEQLPRIC